LQPAAVLNILAHVAVKTHDVSSMNPRSSSQKPTPEVNQAACPEHDAHGWSWWHAVELVATFLVFAGVLHFIYLGPPGRPFDQIGVPGNDSFYHVKMAVLMPEIGLIDTFPWLRTTVFHEKFTNHHYGFQLLLSPFVRLAHQWTGDYAAGGRWFMTVSFGVSMALFNLLLMVRGIERRWLWLALCLLLPSQFYGRHVFVRAIDPSLICMLALCLSIVTRRYLAAGIVVALSIHVYLGAVTYAPVLVLCFFAAGLIGVIGETVLGDESERTLGAEPRRFDGWRLAAWTLAGWVVGLATHPYGGFEAINFLKLQVFGSGLTPEIEVGREWKSYTPAWFFVEMSGVTLTVTALAVCLRLRLGQRLRTDELGLLLISGVFLVLTLKARRFIEYWPLFSTLAAAYLVGPLLNTRPRSSAASTDGATLLEIITVGAACIVALIGCGYAVRLAAPRIPEVFAAEWCWWTLLAGLIALVPIVRYWVAGRRGPKSSRTVMSAVGPTLFDAAILCTAVGLAAYWFGRGEDSEAPRLLSGWMPLAVLAGVYGLVAVIANAATPAQAPKRLWRVRSLVTITAQLAFACLILIPAGALFGALQSDARCQYDLPAIREVMKALRDASQPGDVVFTDDWDIFPVYFYFNHFNYYIVGLDPKFSHEKDPILWERYVRVSRGEIPTTSHVRIVDKTGKPLTRDVDVKLTDIREHFGAKFVVCDRDHLALARKLDRADDFAERIFPAEIGKGDEPPYLLYRILPPKPESPPGG